jgi:hypothetical protein
LTHADDDGTLIASSLIVIDDRTSRTRETRNMQHAHDTIASLQHARRTDSVKAMMRRLNRPPVIPPARDDVRDEIRANLADDEVACGMIQCIVSRMVRAADVDDGRIDVRDTHDECVWAIATTIARAMRDAGVR